MEEGRSLWPVWLPTMIDYEIGHSVIRTLVTECGGEGEVTEASLANLLCVCVCDLLPTRI